MKLLKKPMFWIVILAVILAGNFLDYPKLFFRIFLAGQPIKSSTRHYSSNNPDGFSIWAQYYSWDYISRKFSNYRKDHPADSILYRNFKMNPLYFWEWYDYATDPVYKLPYKAMPPDADSIERGQETKPLGE